MALLVPVAHVDEELVLGVEVLTAEVAVPVLLGDVRVQRCVRVQCVLVREDLLVADAQVADRQRQRLPPQSIWTAPL
jgi:hypothetical protein